MANHSVPRLIETVQLNLDAIEKMLHWNVEKGLLFFRIGSGVLGFIVFWLLYFFFIQLLMIFIHSFRGHSFCFTQKLS